MLYDNDDIIQIMYRLPNNFTSLIIVMFNYAHNIKITYSFDFRYGKN